MSLTPEQESSLTSAGDCFQHYHSSDRLRTHDESRQLVGLESVEHTGAGAYSVPASADYVMVDTSLGSATITLPPPSKLMSVTILRTSGANLATIKSPTGLVNGALTFALAGAYGFAKFKAFNGNYYRVG